MHMLLTLLPLLAPAPQALEVEFVADEVAIPMNLETGHLAVTVHIRGQPYLFQVDTYASIDACIDDDVAEALGLEVVGTVMNSDGVTTQEKNIVQIERLQCGGATFKNLRTLVDDYDWIRRSDGKRVAGLIGFTAFRDLLVTIDYPAQMLVLRRGNLDADDDHVIPFMSPSGSPDIDVLFGDRLLRFGIDTGHQDAFTLHRADAEGLELQGSLQVVGKARSAYSEFKIWGAPFAGSASLAGNRLQNLNLRFSEGKARRLMGYQAFKGFAMTFDQQRKLVSFVAADS